MILLVLLLIFAGLLLFFFVTCWVFPRLATRLGISEGSLAGACVVCGVVAFSVYIFLPIECPYCHNSNANVKGACVKRLRDGSCSEDYYESHYNLSSCPCCGSKGQTTRLAVFVD